MLDDIQTKKFSEDILSFIEVAENQLCFGVITPEDKKKFDWLMDDPGYHHIWGYDCLATRSIKHRDLRCDVKDFCRFYDIEYIPEKKLKRFYFLTLTGKDRIPDTSDNIDKMTAFGKTLFSNENYKRFHNVKWNIETGKHKENPNLHIHAVIWFENSNKNFHSLKPKGRSDVRNNWLQYFKQYGLDYGKDSYQSFSGSKVKEIFDDKCDYLTNKDKCILHKNYRDLQILYEI